MRRSLDSTMNWGLLGTASQHPMWSRLPACLSYASLRSPDIWNYWTKTDNLSVLKLFCCKSSAKHCAVLLKQQRVSPCYLSYPNGAPHPIWNKSEHYKLRIFDIQIMHNYGKCCTFSRQFWDFDICPCVLAHSKGNTKKNKWRNLKILISSWIIKIIMSTTGKRF